MVSFLLLLRLTRTRAENVAATVRSNMELRGCRICSTKRYLTCRCMSRHEWLVAIKGLLVSVFSRRQPNYQSALLLFLTFVICVLGHPSDDFAIDIMSMFQVYVSPFQKICFRLPHLTNLFSNRQVLPCAKQGIPGSVNLLILCRREMSLK